MMNRTIQKRVMMTTQSNERIDRSSGANAISAFAKEIGMEHGIEISSCIWDMGQDIEHQHAHRVDISTSLKTVRLYFNELELTTTGNSARENRIKQRLRSAIAQLLPRSPVPTYATTLP
jgi:hypothetical protein